MAGLYIHVPFCRQACRYCDFYFTVSLKYVDGFVESVLCELESRVIDEEIDTVYFGGGTPSVLSRQQLERILSVVAENYRVSADAEITLEANPDDLDKDYLRMLKTIGFNRLSIGVQSFHQWDLELMRRSHNADQARACLELAAEQGFKNINMDLIYGVPGQSLKEWQENLEIAMKMPVQHLSAYHLSFEEGTVFDLWKKKGRLKEVKDLDSVEQYRLLRKVLAEGGFEHYEISNFALEGFRSRHNGAYWKGVKYLGFGPGAHSYDGERRRWNVSSVKKYKDAVGSGDCYYEEEVLSVTDRYHDYILTALRTMEGVELAYLEEEFGARFRAYFIDKAKHFIDRGEIVELKKKENGEQDGKGAGELAAKLRNHGALRVSEEGWLKGDMIVRELFIQVQ